MKKQSTPQRGDGRTTVKLDSALFDRLKNLREKRGMNISWMVKIAVTEFLSKWES